MKVSRVYTRNIVGTTRSASIESAAALMRRHHVGALLVRDDPPQEQAAVGVLTDRDVVVQAVATGLDTRKTPVGALMTPTVGSILETADLHEALETMRLAGVRRLVVTARGDGKVLGMLSMDDVIDGLAADISKLSGLVKNEVQHERERLGAEDIPCH